MKILALDTSTPSGSVALLEGDRIIAEWTLSSAQTHNRRLLLSIDSLLRLPPWQIEQIDLFAATVGPGSFTGIRIGLTTAKTLAWSLDKPFVGIVSLDALAAPFRFTQYPVCALIDARKKEVFSAVYQPQYPDQGPTMQTDYHVGPPEGVISRVKEPTIFCGDGWLLYRDLFREALGPLAMSAPAPLNVIRASFVGDLARMKFLAGKTEDSMMSVPLYIRPSEAELRYPQA